MSYYIKINDDHISYEAVHEVIQKSGLSTRSVELTERAFKGSFLKVFVFDEDRLIAVGRAISDGVYQAAVYDIAVLPEYQKKGAGKLLMEAINNSLSGFNILLYANPPAVDFYKKLGYYKMKTGMAKFKDVSAALTKGFIE